MNEHDTSPTADSWDTYWHGTGDAGAFSSGGVSHPAIHSFWDELLRSIQAESASPKLLDIATGNGAVVEMALSVFGQDEPDITCVDVSEAAIDNVKRRFPGVTGIVADALSIPLEDEGFDIVTSQFGVEYAGIDATYEAARLLASGGRLALLMHIEGGSVFKECSDSFNAIDRIQKSKFVPFAIELFKTGFAAVRGADRMPYDEAGKQLAPAVQEAEAIMADFGEGVAGDTIARLYGDVGRIHSSLPKYEPDEVLQWLDTMDVELDAYSERMSSMTDAAIDQAVFDQVCKKLGDLGLTIRRAEAMTPPGQDLPLAWVLIADK